jgi:serum/glucocorticoid-regulated kinase 2
MLVGFPPYYDKSREAIFQNIQQARLKLPNCLSTHAKTLIISLLQRNPDLRCEIGDIKKHPFFASIRWDKIMDKTLKPPPLRTCKSMRPVVSQSQPHFTENFDPSKHVIGWSFIIE